jgi:hypothetical protein
MFRTAERRLGVNHPLLTGDGFEKRCEVLFVIERRALPKESQLGLRNACCKPSVSLPPRMQDAEKPDFHSEALGVGTDFEHGGSAGFKQ